MFQSPQPIIPAHTEPLLSVDHLAVRFEAVRGTVQAVDGVSLSIRPGETLGLVGESGCGKSTLGRTIARLIDPHDGKVRLNGIELTRLSRSNLRSHRRDVQMVFQDPLASLDPRWTVGSLIAEPLNIHRIGSRRDRQTRVAELLRKVGLPADAAEKYPHQFSGGQRQRIGIARALALDPKLIILDEPVSALDVSVQAQILNLLVDLQKQSGVAFLFISHDLSVVEYISNRVAVMYLGRIVEFASRDELWSRPAHPYTRALLGSVPRMERGRERHSRKTLRGDLPSPFAPPPGCRFHTRCPVAQDKCRSVSPTLTSIGDSEHLVACHFPVGFS
ncbi:ABC transporter ATP-binding protein [Afipia sp. DC4300-2b1]|uniref:ABC transporter ATP-binding protein n=1 Tax=Afipia sp. DC4300-2b1 TaxID=2804672 RepID=UPI003CF1C9A6